MRRARLIAGLSLGALLGPLACHRGGAVGRYGVEGGVKGQDGSTDDSADGNGGGGRGGSAGSGGAGGIGGAGGSAAGRCKVADSMDGTAACDKTAPPGSFEADIQWAFTPPGEQSSMVTPLVANLTDDNGDGAVDLCDTPDVVLVAFVDFIGGGHIYVLDGKTGAVHYKIPEPVDAKVTPAIGDIDGDGVSEIVTFKPGLVNGTPIAFGRGGAKKWESPTPGPLFTGAVALADLDADGDVEILAGNMVFDHTGKLLWQAAESADVYAGGVSATAAGDLDGDGKMEVVFGHAAYHHDGKEYYVTREIAPGFPQIANLDDDPEPEILITNLQGISMVEHDGKIKLKDLNPTGVAFGAAWGRAAAVHDMDGDRKADFALSSGNNYVAYRRDVSVIWSATIVDASGSASGTAFDCLGDGIAEAMYGDEYSMFIFDGTGKPIFKTERSSGTWIEYPVVADIDNDGSAEIVVVSDRLKGGTQATIYVVRDKQDRWIQARRIWNQHTYHVTNVREDGTIPQHEKPSWQHLNTFRTNSQISNTGGVCRPKGTAGP